MDKEDIKVISSILGLIIFVIAFSIALVAGIEGYSCSSYGDVTGRETKFKALECYVNDDGIWFTRTEYKQVIIAREGLMNIRGI